MAGDLVPVVTTVPPEAVIVPPPLSVAIAAAAPFPAVVILTSLMVMVPSMVASTPWAPGASHAMSTLAMSIEAPAPHAKTALAPVPEVMMVESVIDTLLPAWARIAALRP